VKAVSQRSLATKLRRECQTTSRSLAHDREESSVRARKYLSTAFPSRLRKNAADAAPHRAIIGFTTRIAVLRYPGYTTAIGQFAAIQSAAKCWPYLGRHAL
jgi:hypothetical protein